MAPPRSFISLLLILVLAWWAQLAEARVGWEVADIVLDFGVDVDPGDRQIIIDQTDLEHSVDVDVVWKLHPHHCLVQTLQDNEGNGKPEWWTLVDDQLFNGKPAHAIASSVKALAVVAPQGESCHMDPKLDDMLVVSEIRDPGNTITGEKLPAPLGATVTVFRATAFFIPGVVTIQAGERVVWIYADGAKEPHTVTSGACRGTDCTGGGKQFDSGKTLNTAGHRFEYVFQHPGTFPYHCNLHNASMVGTVIVKPKTP